VAGDRRFESAFLQRGATNEPGDVLVLAMNLKLTDEQTNTLIRELSQIIDGDRYPLSPRIVALKEILGMIRPEPAHPAPLPPRRHYEPPSKGRYSRRR
jgi:hypothetical protein